MTAAPHPGDQPFATRLVSLPVPPPSGFTTADLPQLMEIIGGRFELRDGDIVMMATPTHWHDEVAHYLRSALRGVAPREFVVANEKGVDLGHSNPEPDVLAVSREAVASGSFIFAPTDVHLAIEVMSPGSKTKDRKLRPAQYAEAGIACFWRVENEDDAMVVYTFELLPEGGAYAPTGVHRHRVVVDKPFPIDIELPPVTW
ncbi:Uma2 family endonuclease [Gordonia sp. (in: high G+C Gram-positive bacteria)]|jgi:Uma2 family endonuclease|uniref:Uma2 family endonuclease n=2 Tax=Gordonia sp. (in: high G+C Gram-positive bacteria) TaxID=84139 RepID=UPI0026369A49|nr:Uma2 family endonuclease [Gordonia sp. (in: high G+C Gram-positive bacteria)]HMS75156.1 Uma2 family endonuclease [Gordonia sp. (in: high G+C Gram-positive bacteria)]HQV17727.1 Uma2 family endonuclease [Gordonia sp. (in: high G+C Gram-positive bacteria)]